MNKKRDIKFMLFKNHRIYSLVKSINKTTISFLSYFYIYNIYFYIYFIFN